MKKPKEPTSELILSPSGTSDSSLENSLSAEYDERGWLDCNPEAKMELADLDKEECISDDETEVMPSSTACYGDCKTCSGLKDFVIQWNPLKGHL